MKKNLFVFNVRQICLRMCEIKRHMKILNIIDVVCRNKYAFADETAFAITKPLSKGRIKISWEQFYERTTHLANDPIVQGINKKGKLFVCERISLLGLKHSFHGYRRAKLGCF
jgi:hypothetical protein